MVAKRHLELTGLRTQAACRLHAMLAALRPGGMARRLSVTNAAGMLNSMRPVTPIASQRKAMARQHLGDIRRLDKELKANKALIATAVARAGTTVTDIYGVGPIVAALLSGYSGDIARFASAGSYAAYNGTAPVEYSSGGKRRHRLSRRGNRVLQPRPAHGRGHPDPLRDPRPHLLRPQTRRGQNQKGGAAGLENGVSLTSSTGVSSPTGSTPPHS